MLVFCYHLSDRCTSCKSLKKIVRFPFSPKILKSNQSLIYKIESKYLFKPHNIIIFAQIVACQYALWTDVSKQNTKQCVFGQFFYDFMDSNLNPWYLLYRMTFQKKRFSEINHMLVDFFFHAIRSKPRRHSRKIP